MIRTDCFHLLAEMLPEDVVSVTSLSSNTRAWSTIWKDRANFYGLNMGLCVPFALGIAVALPKHKVVAFESDGSQMVGMTSLASVSDVNPPNLIILCFDNEAYARMGPTATARGVDLEQVARGVGIKQTATVRTMEEFSGAVAEALKSEGLRYIVVKVEAETARIGQDGRGTYGRAMRERYVDKIMAFPDYPGPRS